MLGAEVKNRRLKKPQLLSDKVLGDSLLIGSLQVKGSPLSLLCEMCVCVCVTNACETVLESSRIVGLNLNKQHHYNLKSVALPKQKFCRLLGT